MFITVSEGHYPKFAVAKNLSVSVSPDGSSVWNNVKTFVKLLDKFQYPQMDRRFGTSGIALIAGYFWCFSIPRWIVGLEPDILGLLQHQYLQSFSIPRWIVGLEPVSQ